MADSTTDSPSSAIDTSPQSTLSEDGKPMIQINEEKVQFFKDATTKEDTSAIDEDTAHKNGNNTLKQDDSAQNTSHKHGETVAVNEDTEAVEQDDSTWEVLSSATTTENDSSSNDRDITRTEESKSKDGDTEGKGENAPPEEDTPYDNISLQNTAESEISSSKDDDTAFIDEESEQEREEPTVKLLLEDRKNKENTPKRPDNVSKDEENQQEREDATTDTETEEDMASKKVSSEESTQDSSSEDMPKTLDESVSKCKALQEQAAKELREISTMLRKQQKGMNIAKVSFSSAGVLAGGLGIAGLLLAPVTAGLSVGLTVASVGIGATSAAGGVSTMIAEFKVIRNRVEEAQKVLDDLEKATEHLIEKLKPQLKKHGISVEELMLGLTTEGASLGKTVYDLVEGIKVAIKVVGATTKADRILITLAAQELPNTATKVVTKVGLNPALVGEVAKVASVGFMGVGIGFSLKEVFQNSKNIHKNASRVADKIEEMAAALENNE